MLGNVELALGCLFFSYIIYRFLFQSNIPRGLKLPPGPPPRFLIGNLKDIPSIKEWVTYESWKNTYGDLVHLNVLGKSLLYVNSPELTSELFDTRGAFYSDRFQSTMLWDLVGFDWSLSMMHPDDVWRQHRGIFHKHLSKISMAQYQSTMEKCSKIFVSLLARRPQKLMDHSRHVIGAIIFEVTYGFQIKLENDPYVGVAEKALQLFGDVSRPGAYIVDSLPFMKYIPDWVPGTTFKQKANELKSYFAMARERPFVAVKAAMRNGTATPSIVSNYLDDVSLDESTKTPSPNEDSFEEAIKSIGAVIYLAGIDTSEAVLQIFFLAMVLYPNIQKTAQEELDRVVGPNSFPTFKDRANLPYINALCKEVLRWHTVAPVGFPHVLKQDDVIGEYFVPKGTLVMGNSWSLAHSVDAYGPDANTFNPERFLKGCKDPEMAFGYGRRICPGRHMADNILFILVASVLYTFDITPNPMSRPSLDDIQPGIVSRVKPFQCNITPRTPALTSFLEQISDTYLKD